MNNLSVLICSSDKYTSLWDIHADFLKKNWSDCPYPIYLGTDSVTSIRFNTVTNRSQCKSWSACLLEWVSQIDAEYILLTLDDFILREPVSTSDVENCLEFLSSSKGDCLRLVARPKPFYRDSSYPSFGKFDQVLPYIVSAQASIWKKSTLLALAKSGESIWEFEESGSLRARSGNYSFYGVYRTVFNYGEHILDGGKLLRTSTYNLPVQQYSLPFSYQPISKEIVILLKRLSHFVIHNSPTSIRLRLLTLKSRFFKSDVVSEKTKTAAKTV